MATVDRRDLLRRGAFAAAAAALPARAAEPLRVCLVSGSEQYRSEASLTELQSALEQRYQVACTRAFGKDRGTDLPGLEALEAADVMILFTRRITLPPEQLERVRAYVRAAKPLVGLRTASHAFQNYLELDREVLGGNYQGHYDAGPVAEILPVAAEQAHPVLEGVRPFRSVGSLYRNTGLAADVRVLLTGAIPGHTEPVAWTRTRGRQRVFYTSLGHPDDFREESFRRLLLNGLFWAAGRVPGRKG